MAVLTRAAAKAHGHAAPKTCTISIVTPPPPRRTETATVNRIRTRCPTPYPRALAALDALDEPADPPTPVTRPAAPEPRHVRPAVATPPLHRHHRRRRPTTRERRKAKLARRSHAPSLGHTHRPAGTLWTLRNMFWASAVAVALHGRPQPSLLAAAHRTAQVPLGTMGAYTAETCAAARRVVTSTPPQEASPAVHRPPAAMGIRLPTMSLVYRGTTHTDYEDMQPYVAMWDEPMR